ncbi:MAG: ABC transporter permease [Chloroflexi bacterium]|nr:ABC transporter permease [Chloroflexota bacterium]
MTNQQITTSSQVKALAAANHREGILESKQARRFLRDRLSVLGLVMIIVLLFLAVFAPLLSSHDPYQVNLEIRNQPPSAANWLGTDGNGRDVWTRMIYGGRVSLSVGIVAVSISTVIGVLIGSVAGFFGGLVDMVLMRMTDIVMSFPMLIVVISFVAITGPSIYNSMIAIGILGWPTMARLVRSQFLYLRQVEFVTAAVALGARPPRLIFRHILPNTVGSIVVAVTFAVSDAILLEAALSFLGLGVQVPMPSWGNMLRDAQTLSILENRPWMWIPPGLAIMLAVLSINFIGDGLRDALDPRIVL